ncbi:hypothetical protein AHAS_Ahas11G0331600 [Arachis hypogaea]
MSPTPVSPSPPYWYVASSNLFIVGSLRSHLLLLVGLHLLSTSLSFRWRCLSQTLARGTFGTVHRSVYDGQDVAVLVFGAKFGWIKDGSISLLRTNTILWVRVVQFTATVFMEAWVFCRGELVKRGKLFRSGIFCHCCDSLWTLSQFQAHAGCKGQPPSASIFLEQDKRSLLDCQKQALMMIKANNNGDNDHHHENDSICSICLQGGFILLCDHCPASFHAECIGLDHVPPGDWFCPSCSCRLCNRPKCREESHLANNFIACYQCQRRFHIGCLASRGFAFLNMETDWFCNEDCHKIFLTLNNMLGKPIPVGDGNLTWTLLTSLKKSTNDNDDDGTITEMESKLNVALGIIHECFVPIIDPVFGRDIAADIMFSRYSRLPRMNFTGFYTVILERNDEVFSVANTRIYGQKLAEVPLVATRDQYRNRGMCRILMDQLEKLLVKLGVERLLLPAAPYLVETWTNSFGFAKMTHSDQYYCVGDASVVRASIGANTVQCTATVFMVWPSFDIHVLHRHASFIDTPKHHLRSSSCHYYSSFLSNLYHKQYCEKS